MGRDLRVHFKDSEMPPPNPRPPKLSDTESKMYSVIKRRADAGIWTSDLKKEVVGKPTEVTKALKSLLTKNLIKEVTSIKCKSRKMVMAVEFEPSADIYGGTWYQNGSLDITFIKILRQQCRRHIEEHKVATCEMIRKAIKEPKRGGPSVFTTEITLQQIYEILELMVLDKEVEKVRSSGVGDFSHVPEGRDCYRVSRGEEGPKEGAFASIPCGVCPRIHECTPDGVISPINCVYYNKWLGALDF